MGRQKSGQGDETYSFENGVRSGEFAFWSWMVLKDSRPRGADCR